MNPYHLLVALAFAVAAVLSVKGIRELKQWHAHIAVAELQMLLILDVLTAVAWAMGPDWGQVAGTLVTLIQYSIYRSERKSAKARPPVEFCEQCAADVVPS